MGDSKVAKEETMIVIKFKSIIFAFADSFHVKIIRKVINRILTLECETRNFAKFSFYHHNIMAPGVLACKPQGSSKKHYVFFKSFVMKIITDHRPCRRITIFPMINTTRDI